MLLYYPVRMKTRRCFMANAVTRKDAAKALQVSVPTLRKFIKKHKEILFGKKVDMDKLDCVITEESGKTLQKKGK